ncbi:MAG: hypothetical protein KatS3mg124_0157 [Porticoccaceae bacterium]|nr:MAG: hypothetical protein KatS3mg124_0157 [Porticoccaceae bacterium]
MIDHIIAQHRKALAHAHRVGNVLVELAGECAASEAYVHAALRLEREGRLLQVEIYGRYLDRWERRDGRWRIARRRFVCDFDEVREVVPLTERGRRDPADSSFDLSARRAP